MAFRDLQEFLSMLEDGGELHRVTVEVDPFLEIAEITNRMSKSANGGKALLFERVKGSAYPVATNLFGSFRRMAAALGVDDLQGLTLRMQTLLDGLPATSLVGKSALLSRSAEFAAAAPSLVETGPCQEIVEDTPDLGAYPFLKTWPEDAGFAMTLPLVFTRDLETGRSNCGMYRVRIFDRTTVGIHWQSASGGAGHYAKHRSAGTRMPVAIAIGGDPAIILAAAMPLPEPLDEMQFAGFLRTRPVEMVLCLTSGIEVPAAAEMVLEGYIEPGELREGGFFGNHTGRYVSGGKVPVMHVSCVTSRAGMSCPATVIGPPPMEDCFLAKAAERLLVPFSRARIPALVDINLPLEGIFHGCAIVAIRKEHDDHPQEVMAALWAEGWLRKARMLILVDADVAVTDLSLVAWKVVNNTQWPRDMVFAEGKLGFDATRKSLDESGQEFREIRQDEAVIKLVDRRWLEYGCA